MSSQGIGLYGTGSSGGAVAELISLGAMDAYLIKGAQCTFWRFRYCRHTNFAMEAVGQPFQSQPSFGGHSQIVFNRAGDLLYYMYVVIDLPGIYACRKSKRFSACYGEDDCDYSRGSQFPSQNAYNSMNSTEAKDREFFRKYARNYENVEMTDPCASELGKAAWLKNSYGAGYNGSKFDDSSSSTDCPSVPQEDRPWCHWSNAIGQLLIRRAALVVGGHQTDNLYSDYLFMWEELSGKAGKRLREMIGKRKSRKTLIKDAAMPTRLYVPLPWYFCLNSGNALPLCTLQFHGAQVMVEWERLGKCVVVSSDDVDVRRTDTDQKLSNNDLVAWIDTTYIYLDIEERNRFSLANFDQLITQVQCISREVNGGETTIPLTFNHPTIELIWAVRRKVNEKQNNYFNYSGIQGRDPIEEVSLRLNNLLRFSGREGRYYRLVQPYQHHSSIPKSFVYCYSFALFPEDAQPSGSLNFSRIDNVDMTFKLQDGLGKEQCTVIIFARSWNICRVSKILKFLLTIYSSLRAWRTYLLELVVMHASAP